jgi:hypothetical protein
LQSLLDLLRDKPDRYLDEMADYIEAQFDVAVKPNTIGRELKEARRSNKRISQSLPAIYASPPGLDTQGVPVYCRDVRVL